MENPPTIFGIVPCNDACYNGHPFRSCEKGMSFGA